MEAPPGDVAAGWLAQKQTRAQGEAKMKYYCPKCDYSARILESCPKHNIQLLPDFYSLVGRSLGQRCVDAPVGEGGFGVVYRAHHLTIGRKEALKILKPEIVPKGPKMIERFKKEAMMAGQLHDNIADVYDAGCDEGFFYIAMQWLEGHTLEEEITESAPLNFKRTADLLKQIATALKAIHDAKIIHCDLKPSNIFIVRKPDGSEQVKVLDFGIGKMISETESARVTALLGTLAYMSPEQLRENERIDGRADIYALGVILYEMLAKTLPFTATSLLEWIEQKRNASPRPLHTLRPDAPAEVEKLVNDMLAADPSQRPRDASEIPVLFENALESRQDESPAKRDQAHDPAKPKAEPNPGKMAWTGPRAVLAVCAIIFIAILALWLVLGRGRMDGAGVAATTPIPTPRPSDSVSPSVSPTTAPEPTKSQVIKTTPTATPSTTVRNKLSKSIQLLVAERINDCEGYLGLKPPNYEAAIKAIESIPPEYQKIGRASKCKKTAEQGRDGIR